MQITYVFKHEGTGEIRKAASHALIPAAKSVGIKPTYPGTDLSPWLRWEAWEGTECIWHYTENGDLLSGPRTATELTHVLTTEQDIRELARQQYAVPSDDNIEIDDCAPVNKAAEEGYWVQAWVFVSSDE